MAITTSFVGPEAGIESLRSTHKVERWKVTGATGVATDTATITGRIIRTIISVVGGPCTFSVSSGVATITLKADIGNDSFDVLVIGN